MRSFNASTVNGFHAIAIGSTDMSVTSVAPKNVRQNTVETLWLNGTGFGSATTLRFSTAGITAGPPAIYSSTHLSAIVTVGPGVTPGPGDVQVINPDGDHGTCFGCLTVRPAQ